MVRGVSNPREGSEIRSFLFRSRLVCGSWNVNSTTTFAMTEFSEVPFSLHIVIIATHFVTLGRQQCCRVVS